MNLANLIEDIDRQVPRTTLVIEDGSTMANASDELRASISILREELPSWNSGTMVLARKHVERVLNAADLLLPPTKTKTVWRVLWARAGDNYPMSDTFCTEIVARAEAHQKLVLGHKCVSIAGPEQQEVPA